MKLNIRKTIEVEIMGIYQEDEDFFIIPKKNWELPREHYEEVKKEDCAQILAELKDDATPFSLGRFGDFRKETSNWEFRFWPHMDEVYAFRKKK